MVQGKNILIGITGGIAAYKTPLLIRMLKRAGAEVKVIVTQNALQFVTDTTLQTLSQNKVYLDMYATYSENATEHIALSDWADLAVIAPASANCIGKLASGIADDALSTTLLAFKKPLFICPAMNQNMYDHFSVQKNLLFLKEKGIHLIEPSEGFLACGYDGKGRMEEPEQIMKQICSFFSTQVELSGKKILVTAGPTYEKIDRVRYIGNYSSGRMGFALAEALAKRGAEVVLVTGPVTLLTANPLIKRIDVESAQEMYSACMEHFPSCNMGILAAAVADYRPEHAVEQKIKKTTQELNLKLIQTQDILASLGQLKKVDQLLIGFALETENEIENALKKLHKKNLDCIILNSLNDKGAGFKTLTNKVTLINKKEETTTLPLLLKEEAAEEIVDYLKPLLYQ